MRARTFRTKALPGRHLAALNASQEQVDGFEHALYQHAAVALIGAGGIGSHVAQGVVRKGPGLVGIYDDDEVELQNLSRQLFRKRDIGKNKSICLAKRLRNEGFFQTTIIAYPYRFQEMEEEGHDFTQYRLLVCGVDNNPTRTAVSKYGVENNLPVIHAAVSRDGNSLYCAVQEPGKACFGCMFPHSLNDDTYPCNLPGIIDVLQVVSGFIVFAIDTLICGRHREWNLVSMALDGSMPAVVKTVERNPACPLCGRNNRDGDGSYAPC